jgi:CheY-like chemotaxis protein
MVAKILVIDDDPGFRTLLERMLRSAGHEVIVAADGAEGLQKLGNATPHLVITDLYMPKMDGVEMIGHLRRFNPHIPVIAISGKSSSSGMLSVAQNLGAVAMLEKPFSMQDLLAAVHKALVPAGQPEKMEDSP